MQRFLRIRKLLGEEKFALLTQKKVVVVGLGAVGSYAVEALARSGVGFLRLVDFDRIQISNINRQLYALESTLGLAKAEAAKNRVRDINPQCRIEALELFAHTDTFDEILSDQPDLVIDAIDSLNPKTHLLSECYKRNLTVISSMGAAWRTDPLRIKTGDIFDTSGCPLARQVRKRLLRLKTGRGITCVYSDEPPAQSPFDAAKEISEPGQLIRGRQREPLGSLPTLTGIFGLTLANEALKKLGVLK